MNGNLVKAVFDKLTLGELVAMISGSFDCICVRATQPVGDETSLLYTEWTVDHLQSKLRLTADPHGFKGLFFDLDQKIRLRGNRAEITLKNGFTFFGCSDVHLVFANRSERWDAVDLSGFIIKMIKEYEEVQTRHPEND